MKKLFDRIDAAFSRLNVFLAALVAASIGLFAILIPVNLLLIKLQLGNLPWLYEAVEYALYVGVFISAPWVLQQGAHVRVDVLILAVPKALAVRLGQLLDIVGAGLCLLLCVYGVRAAISEFQDQTLPDKDLRIETWYMMAVFSFAFALLTVEFLLRMRRARAVLAKEETAATEAGF